MSSVIGALRATLGLDSAAFEKGANATEKRAKGLQRNLESYGKSMTELGQKLSVAVTVPLVALAKTSIDAALESRDALASVETTLKSMEGAAGRTSEQLQALASKQMHQSLYDDDDILRKVTTTLLTFGKVSGDVFDRAQQAALDLSAKFGTDLQGSAMMLGKALNDPVKGITALTRAGISFTAQQREQIKAMVAAGKSADAQKLILGELERQVSGSAAAAMKANPFAELKRAWADFQENVGGALLKILPNITAAITRALNAFSNLSPGMQQAVVIGGALAAALGPVLVGLGALVTASAPFVSVLRVIASEGGLFAAARAGAIGLGTALGPLILQAGLLAGAGYLIYQNWDKIGPAFKPLVGQVNALLVGLGLVKSQTQSALESLASGFAEIGTQAVAAGKMTKQQADAMAQELGRMAKSGEVDAQVLTSFETLIAKLRETGQVAPEEAEKIKQAMLSIREQSSAPPSEFSGWEKLGRDFSVLSDNIQKTVDAFDGYNANQAKSARARNELISSFVRQSYEDLMKWGTNVREAVSKIPGYFSSMVGAIRTWVLDKLNAVWDQVQAKINAVKGWFYGLYDAVVGHSYIPDMVDGIAAQMGRLDSVMVKPAEAASRKAADVFRTLAEEVRPLLDRLFPEAAALNAYRADLKTIGKAERGKAITSGQADEARYRLAMEGRDSNSAETFLAGSDVALGNLDKLQAGIKKLVGINDDSASQIGVTNVRVVQSFKDMAEATLGALDRMASAIKGGGFLNILSSVIGLGVQLGSIGTFGKSIQTNINSAAKVPGFAGGTNFAPGGMAVVGERGPELVNLRRGSQVIPNHALGGTTNYNFSGNLMTDEFWRRIQAGEAAAANAGGELGVHRMAARESWRLR